MRYTLFSVLVSHLDLRLYDVILERHHPLMEHKRIDMTVLPTETRLGLDIEFKYNRRGKSNQPRTVAAGALCNDMMRCAGLCGENKRAFVVLVTDAEMHKYWTNHATKHPGSIYAVDDRWVTIDEQFIKSQPKTFRYPIEMRYEYACDVATVFTAEAAADHFVRVSEVRDPSMQ